MCRSVCPATLTRYTNLLSAFTRSSSTFSFPAGSKLKGDPSSCRTIANECVFFSGEQYRTAEFASQLGSGVPLKLDKLAKHLESTSHPDKLPVKPSMETKQERQVSRKIRVIRLFLVYSNSFGAFRGGTDEGEKDLLPPLL